MKCSFTMCSITDHPVVTLIISNTHTIDSSTRNIKTYFYNKIDYDLFGPYLLFLYLNALYSYNTLILLTCTPWESVRDKVKTVFYKLTNYLHTLKLCFDVQKTHYNAYSLTEANRPDFDYISLEGIPELP